MKKLEIAPEPLTTRILWNGPGRRMLALKWALCAAQLSAMLVAPRVWMSDRPFPTVPALSGLPDLPTPFCEGLSVLLGLSLFVLAWLPNPRYFAFVPPLVGAVLVLFDINRLQPWFFEYALMFVALGFVRWEDPEARRSKAAWAACGMIAIGIYFWSGIQKANPTFAHQVFPWLLQPFGGPMAQRLSPLWPVAPVVEAAIGVGLLIPRTRTLGIVGAVAMHLLLLGLLGPFGQNFDSIVWPWNVWAAAIALILFGRTDRPVLRTAWPETYGKAIVILFGLMPALNFVDRWDGFLSASFYSGKLRDGWIYLTPEGVRHLPRTYVQGNDGLVQESGIRYRLDILRWSMSKLNAPPYAEPRNYVGIVKKLEAMGVPPHEMLLVVRDRPSLLAAKDTYSPYPVH